MKVFYSSSFFGGIRFFIRSPTKNPLTFGRTCQMVIFAPSNRVMVNAFFKNLPPKKSSILKKSRAKIPLVMGFPLNCSIALMVTRMTLSCLYFHGSIQFVQFSHLVHQVRNILIEVNFYSHNIVFIL